MEHLHDFTSVSNEPEMNLQYETINKFGENNTVYEKENVADELVDLTVIKDASSMPKMPIFFQLRI